MESEAGRVTARSIGEFRASYDGTTKVVSTITVLLLLAIPIATQNTLAAALVGGLDVLLLALAYAYSPRGYAISEGDLVVRRLIGDVRFPLTDVRSVRIATAEDLRGCVRLWGSGGLFGYYGLFRTSKLGRSSWYMTNRRNAVVVITAAKTALLSPDETSRFVAAVQACAPGAGAPAGEWLAPLEPGGAGWSLAAWIGAPLAVLVLGVVALALLYSPGPPDYTLTADALTIRDRLYPVTVNKSAVDVAGIRVVNLAIDTGWRPTARTDGFANSHYQSGWYRVANGAKVRLYRASATRLVLLPPKGEGAPVLLEAADPDRFAEELRQRWGPA